MRRDMDLIRTILLEIEEHASFREPFEVSIEGFSTVVIQYHLWLLEDAGFINMPTYGTSKDASYRRNQKTITWAGHEFLDAARNENLWNKAMGMVGKETGSVSVAVLTQLLGKLAQEALNLI